MTRKIILTLWAAVLLTAVAAQAQTLNKTELTTGLGGFETVSLKGDQTWYWDSHNGMSYAKMSGYADGKSYDNADWLVSPEYDLSGMKRVTVKFDHILNFGTRMEKEQTLWVTDCYSSDPEQITWLMLQGWKYPKGNSWSKVSSGEIEVPEEMLKKGVRFAFMYESTTNSAATWEVMNFNIKGYTGDDTEQQPDPEPNPGTRPEYEEYYRGIEGKCDETLLKALDAIISNHTVLSYDAVRGDRARADIRPDGTIWDIYTDCRFRTGDYCNGSNFDTETECDCYNREHALPKSWWGGSKEEPMNTDLVHIFPTDNATNRKRSAWPYGEVGNPSWSNKAGSKYGMSGAFGEAFEPADEYKGDLARVYFYMLTCYSDVDFAAGGRGYKQFIYSNVRKLCMFKGSALSMFLKWHRQDPVSEKERDRNEVIEKKQRNRNPFVDYPHLVEHIWGSKKTTPFHFVPNDVALDDVEDINHNIYVTENSVHISNLYNSSITLRDICGRTVYSTTAKDYDHTFEVEQPGVYILTVDRETTKIIIK